MLQGDAPQNPAGASTGKMKGGGGNTCSLNAPNFGNFSLSKPY